MVLLTLMDKGYICVLDSRQSEVGFFFQAPFSSTIQRFWLVYIEHCYCRELSKLIYSDLALRSTVAIQIFSQQVKFPLKQLCITKLYCSLWKYNLFKKSLSHYYVSYHYTKRLQLWKEWFAQGGNPTTQNKLQLLDFAKKSCNFSLEKEAEGKHQNQ